MKYTVVVIDDEKLIARNIAKNVSRAHDQFEVIAIFNNGLEAFDAIPELLPDVIITDIRMPEKDGMELTKNIYQEYPFIYCIIVSGFDDFEYAKEAIHYNVTDYLLKPINLDEIKVALANIEKKLLAAKIHPDSDLIQFQKKSEDIVNLVKEYVQNNYSAQINLSALADSFGFSLSWLTKLFIKYANITPSKYIKEYRMNIAKQLLRDSSLTISNISQQTGFLDQFHFSKAFKQVTGVSPSEYRSQILKSEN
jgi:YesN/AraC family two-component response regulator